MAARLLVLVGIVGLLAGVAVAAAQTAHRQLGSNLVRASSLPIGLPGGARLCQDAERIPAGTSALRFTLGTYGRPGPALEVRITGAEGRAGGRMNEGWRQGRTVIPVSPSPPAGVAEICLHNIGTEQIAVGGEPFDPSVGAQLDGEQIGARARIEYTTAERSSWWGAFGALRDRVGAVRIGFPGPATMWVWIALLCVVTAGVTAMLLVRRRRRACVAVAAIALANALAWGLVVPPFQVPDEPAHFYYASYLAQTGEAPLATPAHSWYSPRMIAVLDAMQFPRVIGDPDNRPPWTADDRELIETKQRSDTDETGSGDAATASTNAPIYYLLQAGAYHLTPSSNMLDRLAAMRLLSAVLSMLTVVCIFGFLRELLPGRPWAAVVGALAAGLQPMFGFISSGVNNDGGLYLCSALLFWGLARIFRLGLIPRRAGFLGGVLAVGTLVKTQLLGFAPAVALALLVLAVRGPMRRPRVAWRSLMAAAACIFAPLAVYFVLGQTVWDRPVIDRVGSVTDTAASSPGLGGLVSYVWQSYLPRLPFMHDWFPGFALRDFWIDGLIGRFGWLDYSFDSWVVTLGERVVALVAFAAVVTLVRHRDVVRGRMAEALVYVVAAVGFALVVAAAGYYSGVSSGQPFEQPRYLLPLLPLYAAAVALAVGALGRRWTHVLGSLIVLAALAHTVFAQLLTLTRYYG